MMIGIFVLVGNDQGQKIGIMAIRALEIELDSPIIDDLNTAAADLASARNTKTRNRGIATSVATGTTITASLSMIAESICEEGFVITTGSNGHGCAVATS
jgi:hypothetical protein